jgi:hypothetical protein
MLTAAILQRACLASTDACILPPPCVLRLLVRSFVRSFVRYRSIDRSTMAERIEAARSAYRQRKRKLQRKRKHISASKEQASQKRQQ